MALDDYLLNYLADIVDDCNKVDRNDGGIVDCDTSSYEKIFPYINDEDTLFEVYNYLSDNVNNPSLLSGVIEHINRDFSFDDEEEIYKEDHNKYFLNKYFRLFKFYMSKYKKMNHILSFDINEISFYIKDGENPKDNLISFFKYIKENNIRVPKTVFAFLAHEINDRFHSKVLDFNGDDYSVALQDLSKFIEAEKERKSKMSFSADKKEIETQESNEKIEIIEEPKEEVNEEVEEQKTESNKEKVEVNETLIDMVKNEEKPVLERNDLSKEVDDYLDEIRKKVEKLDEDYKTLYLGALRGSYLAKDVDEVARGYFEIIDKLNDYLTDKKEELTDKDVVRLNDTLANLRNRFANTRELFTISQPGFDVGDPINSFTVPVLGLNAPGPISQEQQNKNADFLWESQQLITQRNEENRVNNYVASFKEALESLRAGVRVFDSSYNALYNMIYDGQEVKNSSINDLVDGYNSIARKASSLIQEYEKYLYKEELKPAEELWHELRAKANKAGNLEYEKKDMLKRKNNNAIGELEDLTRNIKIKVANLDYEFKSLNNRIYNGDSVSSFAIDDLVSSYKRVKAEIENILTSSKYSNLPKQYLKSLAVMFEELDSKINKTYYLFDAAKRNRKDRR